MDIFKFLFKHNRALKWKKFRDIALCFNDLLIHMEHLFRVRFFFQIDVFAFFWLEKTFDEFLYATSYKQFIVTYENNRSYSL